MSRIPTQTLDEAMRTAGIRSKEDPAYLPFLESQWEQKSEEHTLMAEYVARLDSIEVDLSKVQQILRLAPDAKSEKLGIPSVLPHMSNPDTDGVSTELVPKDGQKPDIDTCEGQESGEPEFKNTKSETVVRTDCLEATQYDIWPLSKLDASRSTALPKSPNADTAHGAKPKSGQGAAAHPTPRAQHQLPSNSFYDTEPLVDVSILKKQHVQLTKYLDANNVLLRLGPHLLYTEVNAIKAEVNQDSKNRLLLDILYHKTVAKSYTAFNVFVKALAGMQPKLFSALAGRFPTQTEADFCLKDLSLSLKREIIDKGHKTDSPLDEEIDLDCQHVQLHIIQSEPNDVHFARTDVEVLYSSQSDTQLPHEYQHHLSEIEKKGGNVKVQSILKLGQNQGKSVVMSGRAGVGKSTTLQWLARQWALNKWAMGFTLLFFLQLSMLSQTDTHMTAIELLTLYGLFQVSGEEVRNTLCSWLNNAAGRVVVFVDGIDEILGFAQKFNNAPKIVDLNQKAHPIDLCVNILRGDLLPGCTVICTSRPFAGLCALRTDTALEILGLTQKQVKEYVEKRHPPKAKEIMSVLHTNPLLMSACGITFYCMAVSSLLNQGVIFMQEDFQTYSRLTAFIMIQYVSRKLIEWPFVIEVSSYFSKLAHLAYKGIFQLSEQGISKITFNEYDLAEVRLTPSELQSIKMLGILQIKEIKTSQGKSCSAEFLHLTMQEMLAAVYLISNPLPTNSVLKNVFSGGQFNMALMYLFGFQYDNKSKWIKDIRRAVSPDGFSLESGIKSHISDLLGELCHISSNALKVCQLVYESQEEVQARSMVPYVAPWGVINIRQTAMTAIDLMAIGFVCNHSQGLTEITLHKVNMDDMLMDILLSNIIKRHIKSLQSLDVSENNISAEGAVTLTQVVCECKCLKRLNVSHNYIGVNRANLMVDDGMNAFSEALDNNSSLQILNVSHNFICDDGLKVLAKSLHTNNSLQVLDISQNFIGDDGVKDLAEALHENETLKELIIGSNQIGKQGAYTLAEAMKVTQSIHKLKLCSNNIRDSGVTAFAESLGTNTSLTSLDVALNNIGPDGAKALAKALDTNSHLTELDVSFNHIGDDGIKAIAVASCTNKYLTTLTIRSTDIGPDGAAALAEALHTNTCLQELDFSGNHIGDEGARSLSRALCKNQSVTTLTIRSTDIGPDGAAALAEALYKNTCLQELDLSGNHIGDEGARSLSRALCKNQSVTTLTIRSTDIGPDGAAALAEALHSNTCLQYLDLSGNHIGDEGARSLSRALCKNQRVTTLTIRSTDIGPEGAKALAEALLTNTCLQELDLSCNHIDKEGAEALAGALDDNMTLHTLKITGNNLGVGGTTRSLKENIRLIVSDIGHEGEKTLTLSRCH